MRRGGAIVAAVLSPELADGAAHGTSRTVPFDRWFRYPAGFSPRALERALDVMAPRPGWKVIDPFAGAGTAGTGLQGTQAQFVGIEAHPLVAELADLKFRRPSSPSNLREAARQLLTKVVPSSKSSGEHELVRRCFEAETLDRLVDIREALSSAPDESRTFLKWALLGLLREVASVRVGWPYQRPALKRRPPFRDVNGRFVARVEMIADDLAQSPTQIGQVFCGDSRDPAVWDRASAAGGLDGCISSPPYLNNFDYADATRLEVYFSRYAGNWRELCTGVRRDMIVASTQQTSRARATQSREALVAWPSVFEEVGALTDSLSIERGKRLRGKEYDQLLPSYIHDIGCVFTLLHANLRPGSLCVFVVGDSAPYGVYIDTPRLLSELAQDVGFATASDDVIRRRGDRWKSNGSRHRVALTERLLVLRR